MTPDQLIDKLNWRYATKSFDSTKKIEDATWEKIEDSLVLTPSSFGLQPWKFIVVTDQAVKDALMPHAWGQPQLANCSHLVILAARKDTTPADVAQFINNTFNTCGGDKDALSGYQEMMNGFLARMSAEQRETWAKNQVYIALGQLMTSAAVLDIDACPMEGITPPEFDQILGLEGSGFTTTLACPMGYRCEEDKYSTLAKVRYAKADIITHI